jgi:hypothetical protein
VEYVLLALPGVLALVWTVRRCLRRRAERDRLARIRASVDEWLTPEWVDDDAAPDVPEEEPPESEREPPFRWFGSGSAGYHRGRSA